MNKISLIIRREYLSRVRKRSFIVMTFLGPLLMAAIMIVPIYFAQVKGQLRKIAVLDETGLFYEKFQNTDNLIFEHVHGAMEEEKEHFISRGFYALLVIPRTDVSLPSKAVLYSGKQPGLNIKSHIENIMKKEIEGLKLAASGVDQNILESIKTKINLLTIRVGDDGTEEKSFTEVAMVVGLFSAILIYMFVFLFGAQVMRGVIEEKTNRIVELIVSSVRPFQLMMGKIVGIALVGLTQFLLWVLLTGAIFLFFKASYADKFEKVKQEQLYKAGGMPGQTTEKGAWGGTVATDEVSQVFQAISSINFGLIIGTFLFFFLGGYLLYAALFAAIGSAVDNEADTQQFMLPITVPLILSIVLAQYILNNPDGPVAFWFSIIPLTSPIIMMIRIPFGVPVTELVLSAILLILGFLGTTWLAAKIYRTGILMYGKKVDYRELWKWVRYHS